MTFEQFRRFGYVSRLSEIEAKGPSTQTVNTQGAITQDQLDLARTEQQTSSEDRARALEYQQPLVDKEKALASGDATEALRASMPVISQISKGYQGAKDSIFNSIAPGASRDRALADLEVGKSVAPAMARAEAVRAAPEVLANIGSGFGAFSLQELGGALSGYGGASSSNQAQAKMQGDQQAAKWAPLVGIAGAAGGALSGTKLWGK